jgi:hypothetical protein
VWKYFSQKTERETLFDEPRQGWKVNEMGLKELRVLDLSGSG